MSQKGNSGPFRPPPPPRVSSPRLTLSRFNLVLKFALTREDSVSVECSPDKPSQNPSVSGLRAARAVVSGGFFASALCARPVAVAVRCCRRV
jgi:hypothetical protein